jgi:hypothetical protein
MEIVSMTAPQQAINNVFEPLHGGMLGPYPEREENSECEGGG